MQRVMAEVGLVEEIMRVVMISWRAEEQEDLDREIVGEDVVRETARWALAETDILLADGQPADKNAILNRKGGVGGVRLTFFLCHDARTGRMAFSFKAKDLV